jgi:hypothetical protein
VGFVLENVVRAAPLVAIEDLVEHRHEPQRLDLQWEGAPSAISAMHHGQAVRPVALGQPVPGAAPVNDDETLLRRYCAKGGGAEGASGELARGWGVPGCRCIWR